MIRIIEKYRNILAVIGFIFLCYIAFIIGALVVFSLPPLYPCFQIL
jgi:hypothetical protein